MGLVAYLILFSVCMQGYHRYIASKRSRIRREIKQILKHLNQKLNWDRDLLVDTKVASLEAIIEEGQQLLKNKASEEEFTNYLQNTKRKVDKFFPETPQVKVSDFLEFAVVVVVIIMALRTLYLQPFKIPTGSMQPTLFGFHYQADENVKGTPGIFASIFDWMTYGRSTVYAITNTEGSLQNIEPSAALNLGPLRLFEETKIQIAEKSYTIPADYSLTQKHFPGVRKVIYAHQNNLPIPAGVTLGQGYFYTGDHIIVDRVSYNFVEPKRGDVVVFVTTGLQNVSGLHYIKRLVGIPGDTLKIVDRKLYVRNEKNPEFTLVNLPVAFERMYSFKGGYKGYSNENMGIYLRTPEETITLKEDEYFMLGDNSESSGDSRFFGVIPRKNIMGKACFVWWPFSRRWGVIDHEEPLEFDSPPTSGLGYFE